MNNNTVLLQLDGNSFNKILSAGFNIEDCVLELVKNLKKKQLRQNI